ncbi:helicase MOV-10 isoform X2 [Lethenteron reissneri]|uniref:helicase MOV-10 isoform X2 n=1 Tax=Lethenteron reissneri TaxID=7753 RepID=UPI002AB7505C|nr:helicase MOV-10 isoform X2 [Lethenteron reissneri]
MPAPSRHECVQTGLEFELFLQQSGFQPELRVFSKAELRDVYNQSFRNSDEQRRPNFSSMIYYLKQCENVRVRNGNIAFKISAARPDRRPSTASFARGGGHSGGVENLVAPSEIIPLDATRSARRATLIQLLRTHKAWMLEDKHGISITAEPPFVSGDVKQQLLVTEKKRVTITIRNQGTTCVQLRRCDRLRKMVGFSLTSDIDFQPNNPLFLPAGGKPFCMHVTFCTKTRGHHILLLVFEFLFEGEEVPFHVARSITMETRSELSDALQPTKPYEPIKQRPPIYRNRCTVDGVKPDISWLQDPLTFLNYKKKFHHLLHLDELQMRSDIRVYDLEDQIMEPDLNNRKLLKLRVPGVAESRPSVLRGDRLVVSESARRSADSCMDFTGYVHGVHLEDVSLGFSPSFLNLFVKNMKFDVMFTFNRTPLKLQHRAVDQAVANPAFEHVLFPTGSYNMTIQDPSSQLVLYNRILSDNPEQYRAVQNIVSGISRPAPYLIFGPPGTGKTVTLVESIRQVVKCIPGTHVLACAPSNSAADLICQQLIPEIGKNNIYRLNAYSRDWNSIPAAVKECSNWDGEQKRFWYPKKEDLMTYKVLVTTLITAGRLVSASFHGKGHFSHIFVDEAGQAVEPECLVAVAGLLRPPSQVNQDGGQLVLAGDPKQLGPIIRSPLAIKHHLNRSLIERLMNENPLYQKSSDGFFNHSFVTKLLKNYRSHPAILELPNTLFYEGELQVCADELKRNNFCQWEHLPTKGFPVIFHSVIGQDTREENSPSFFNVAEVEEVVSYLTKILESSGKKGLAKVSPKEIGVIAPYRKQVQKIKKAITEVDKELRKRKDIRELKVGSVEEFQGQERTAIIISTVRSDMSFLSFDEKFGLGFLRNPKRFNVALTRAKALLVVIGNPVTLSKDPNWESFINYCRSRGGFMGVDIREEDEDPNEMDGGVDAGTSNGIKGGDVNVEAEWRREL